MNPSDLVDHSFGPAPHRICVEKVSEFVAATGDDPDRWGGAAPPGFMATALFVVASDLLGRLSGHSVIHGEQVFNWHRTLVMESELQVTGKVTRVREREGVSFVNFAVDVDDDQGTVADGSSLFLISGELAPGESAEGRPEPAPDDDGDPAPGQVSATRAGLVRYAAATRDWNPIHWDHHTAVAAGLPGVIAHGLLQSAWAFCAVSKFRPGDVPLRSARVRFRNPLPPATPVTINVEVEDDTAAVAITGDSAEYLGARIELAGR